MKIVVFGGSGVVGRGVVAELRAGGHKVTVADRRSSADPTLDPVVELDASDLAEVVTVARDADALVNMASSPSPRAAAPPTLFRNNLLVDYAVLEAASLLGIKKVVMSSSINAIGAAFGPRPWEPPGYFPIDEDHPTRCQDAYAITKWLGEEMARAFARRDASVQIASLRYAAVVPNDEMPDLHKRARFLVDGWAGHFWSWVALSDAAVATRLAVEGSWKGHEAFFLCAPYTMLQIDTAEALATAYPNVPLRAALPGRTSLVSCRKAEERLGWRPRHQTLIEP
jgi:nucleoside-diphosphate-sugar epimerase